MSHLQQNVIWYCGAACLCLTLSAGVVMAQGLNPWRASDAPRNQPPAAPAAPKVIERYAPADLDQRLSTPAPAPAVTPTDAPIGQGGNPARSYAGDPGVRENLPGNTLWDRPRNYPMPYGGPNGGTYGGGASQGWGGGPQGWGYGGGFGFSYGPAYGPNFGPNYGAGFGGPGFGGSGYGPISGPNFQPGYGAGYGPGYGIAPPPMGYGQPTGIMNFSGYGNPMGGFSGGGYWPQRFNPSGFW